jgi:hypothetical protein
MATREPGTTPPDAYVVARGGEKPLPPRGTPFSAAAGVDRSDAGAGVPHGRVRFATVAGIRDRGGTVEWRPELTRTGRLNDRHVDVTEGRPGAFGEPEPNPVPKVERIS